MNGKAIVLDANILIRAVMGKRVRELIFGSVTTVKFFAPDVAYADARKYLPALLIKRGIDSSEAMLVLDQRRLFSGACLRFLDSSYPKSPKVKKR